VFVSLVLSSLLLGNMRKQPWWSLAFSLVRKNLRYADSTPGNAPSPPSDPSSTSSCTFLSLQACKTLNKAFLFLSFRSGLRIVRSKCMVFHWISRVCVGLGGVVLLPVQAESDLGWDWCRKVGVRCCCCGWSRLG